MTDQTPVSRPLTPFQGMDIRTLIAPGEVGDLYVEGQKGVSLFLEYANDPAATAAAFTPEGLFNTGDRVRIESDGWHYFADRSKPTRCSTKSRRPLFCPPERPTRTSSGRSRPPANTRWPPSSALG